MGEFLTNNLSKRAFSALLAFALSLFVLGGCAGGTATQNHSSQNTTSQAPASIENSKETISDSSADGGQESQEDDAGKKAEDSQDENSQANSLKDVADYSGKDYIELNGGKPQFSEAERALKDATEQYGKLDSLGRATSAFAKLCTHTRPPAGAKRDTKMPNPSGWVQAYYPQIGLNHLYERSHLIAYSLSDEATNPLDLITGTEHMNQDTMQIFERKIRNYLDGGNASNDKKHVLMRVTPDFRGNDLVARGVQIEALSLEDEGAAICINVYCYNVQPNVVIDYSTGKSWLAEGAAAAAEAAEGSSEASSSSGGTSTVKMPYVLNTNTKKFHLPNCRYASTIKAKNKKSESTTADTLKSKGYKPCGVCKP